MSNPAIENLIIENFKCFKHLEVTNIGRVNLIGGKNNVGKTAFLEAVELLSLPENPIELLATISSILVRRQANHPNYIENDFFYGNSDTVTIGSDIKNCQLKASIGAIQNQIIITPNQNNSHAIPTEIIKSTVNDNTAEFPKEHLGRLQIPAKKYIFIPSSKCNDQHIAILFGALTDARKEVFLNESLSLFDSNIIELRLIPKEGNILLLKLAFKNKDSLVLLSSLGEGINRYIAILCAIWANKDGVLLIDEIENGIHYTNYKKLWQIIFRASIDANCQLFITTHSKECISAFNEVQFENEQCNAQYFEFYRNLKTDLIVASNIDKERLHYSLTHEGRIRGE